MGNILTVASIIFVGGTYIRFNSVSNFCHPLSFTFFRKNMFSLRLIKFIRYIYRNRLLDESKARETVEVSGDGKCDTPGYNAKYCTYSIMSRSNSKILHFHVVTVVETSSSVAMEKYGLVKALDKLQY